MCKTERWQRHSTSDLIARNALYIGDGYRAKNAEMGATGLPFARAGNINGGFRFDGADLLDESNVPKAGGKVSQPSDIVFTSKGTVGRFAFVRPETPRFVYSPQLCYWRVQDSSVIDVRFLFSWMHGPEFLNQVQRVKGLTDMADYVSLSDQRRMHITLPPLEEQKKISAILSAYDDLIENNTRRIKIHEEMAQMIYREWFVNFRFPGHEKVRMVESELGPIPEGWSVQPLGNLTSVVTKGTTPTTLGRQFQESGVNFVKVEAIAESGTIIIDKLAKIDADTHELLKRSQLRQDDILFSIAGAIGRVALVPLRILPANTNQALAILRCSDPSFVTYLLSTVRSNHFQNFSLGRVVQTAQANVSLSILKSAPILVPSPAVLADFSAAADPIQRLVSVASSKIDNLRTTRDLLLPKLVSGEIPVEAADDTAAEMTEEVALHA